MTPRAARLERLLAEHAAPHRPGPAAVCHVAALVCGVDEAALQLAHGLHRAALHTTGPLATAAEDLQTTTGEGPCADALHTRAAVAATDLAHPVHARRWPLFTPLAHSAGLAAVTVHPLHVGAVRLGTLALYRRTPGPLTPPQDADALLLASFAADQLLTAPQTMPLPPDSLHIHQATGMAAAQTGTSLDDAFARLRAHAFATARPLSDVARQVLDGTLDFSPGTE